MMDAEGARCGGYGIEHGPLELKGGAVPRHAREEVGNLVAAAADAKGANRTGFDGVFEETKKSVVTEFVGSDFVQQPDVDVIGLEGRERAVERGPGLRGGEDRLVFFRCGRACHSWRGSGACEPLLERGEGLEDGPRNGTGKTFVRTAGSGRNAVLCGDGALAGMPAQEVAEIARA